MEVVGEPCRSTGDGRGEKVRGKGRRRIGRKRERDKGEIRCFLWENFDDL